MTRRIAQLLPVVLLLALNVPLSAQPGSNDELRAKAEQGDVQAQYNLGIMYETGRGGPQDEAEAVRWYRLAAEQGDAEAQFNLGAMHASGRGVPQDDVTAHMWFNLAESHSTGAHQNQATQYRDIMADRLNSDQLAEAQRLAREWNEAHPRD